MGLADRVRQAGEWVDARNSAWFTNLALLLFGMLLINLTWTGTQEFHHYIHGFGEGMFGQLVLYLGAISLVERSPTNRWTLPLLIAVGFAARLVAVAQPPFLSTDIYRYVWDGMVQNAGINPYRYIPADPHLHLLRDMRIYPHINRRNYAHTIYPPASEFLFLLIARLHAGVAFMKLVLVALEGVTCYALIRCMRLLAIPVERVVIYFWHPVAIWEVASSGHVDAAAVTFIALAILASLQNQSLRATSWIAIATLIKLYPAALLPAFVRRRIVFPALLFAGIVFGGYLPYLSVGTGVFGFLPGYAKEEGLDSGKRFFPLDLYGHVFHTVGSPLVYIALSAAFLGALAWWAFRRGLSGPLCISSGLVLGVGFNLCFSPHYPWYFLWLLPFLALWPWQPAFYMVLAPTFMLATKLGAPLEISKMNVRLYGGFFLFLLWDILMRMRKQRREMSRVHA